MLAALTPELGLFVPPETFLLFPFGDPQLAQQALELIRTWVSAFRLTQDQLSARCDASDSTVYVRLKFDAHEANAYRRWLERIPREPPFVQAEVRTVVERAGDFRVVRDRFEQLHTAD
ncbi:MAG: hypothetical protein HY653_06130 [Acidobacteria bacterium]|nr:hypothetical protein [Acidobacteriota bacterium]